MVHWILDTSISRSDPLRRGGEAAWDDLIMALKRSETPYTLVRTIPWTTKLIDPDWDSFQSEEPPELILDITGPVFVTGIMSMKGVCAHRGWNPGYVDAPGQSDLIKHWGTHVLNHSAVIDRFETAAPPARNFFARPVEDTKSFAGTVFACDPAKPDEGDGQTQWEKWRAEVMGLETSTSTIQPDDMVLLAPLQNIYAEYRLYVVGGQIVTGSRYKLGSRVFYTQDLPPDMMDYARARLAEYCPRRALCFDIAHVEGDDPFKIIETNSISSSGFYACDMGQFVGAINAEFECD